MSDPTASTSCGRCGEANPAGRRFCRRCGEELPAPCADCKFVNAAGDAFCGGCGTALSARAPSRGRAEPLGGGDRRWVTAEFVDLVSSTRLSGQLDPEDLRDVLRDYHSVVGEIVDAQGGTVARVQGDGVFAYFGWPVAHGDDTRRAVRAGLDVVDRVAALAPAPLAGLGAELAVRVGIHTGLTVVSDMGAADRVEIDDLVGDTPLLASRLQAMAAPGEVLLSEAVARQVAGWFDLEDPGPVEVKGMDEPVSVRRALAPTTARSRIEARYGSDVPPLVGRSAELEWLERRAAEAASRPVVAVVMGDAGAGKSRLVRAFLDQRDDLVLVLSCRETHQRTALHPLVALDVPPPGVSELVAGPAPGASRASWLAGLAATLAAAAGVVVIEDAHWADPTTLDLVAALSRVDRSLLVLVTARADNGPAGPALTASHTWALDGLGADEVVELVGQVAAGRSVPHDVTSEIVTRAAGNPLFAEELTEAYLDAGEDVPAGLQALLTARLDRLGPDRQLVQVAAVIGTRFDAAVLETLAPGAAEGGLDRLVDERIVEPRTSADGRATFEFRHALVHQVAYESVMRRERRSLHGRLADTLLAEERSVPPEAIARHLEAAGRPEAWEHWARAARQAMRASNWAEAADQLEAAIALVAADADDPDAARRELDLRSQHTLASGMAGQEALVDQRDAATRLVVLARGLADTQQQVYGGLLLAIAEQSLGEFERALRRIGEVVDLAASTGDTMFEGVARVVRGAMAVWLGADGPAPEHLEATLADLGFALDQLVTQTSAAGPRRQRLDRGTLGVGAGAPPARPRRGGTGPVGRLRGPGRCGRRTGLDGHVRGHPGDGVGRDRRLGHVGGPRPPGPRGGRAGAAHPVGGLGPGPGRLVRGPRRPGDGAGAARVRPHAPRPRRPAPAPALRRPPRRGAPGDRPGAGPKGPGRGPHDDGDDRGALVRTGAPSGPGRPLPPPTGGRNSQPRRRPRRSPPPSGKGSRRWSPH